MVNNIVESKGKVVASHAEVALIYAMDVALRGYCSSGWGCDQSIGSTVSDAIVRSWLWLTATRSSHWAASVHYCK